MSTLIPYNASTVVFEPTLGTSPSDWHITNRTFADSEAGCSSFSAGAVQPPSTEEAHSWGAHTLSFNFSGPSIFLYGLVDDSYTWNISIDDDSEGAFRSVVPTVTQCPASFFNRTDLGNSSHSLTFSINPAERTHSSLGIFMFAYASTTKGEGSSPASIDFQSANSGSKKGDDRKVVAYILGPLLGVALILGVLGYFIRRRKLRKSPASRTAATVTVRDPTVHNIHFNQMTEAVMSSQSESISTKLHSRNPSKQFGTDADV